MLTAERERTAQLPERTRVYCRLSTHVKAKLYDHYYCLYMLRRLRQEGLSVTCLQMPPLHSEKIGERSFLGEGASAHRLPRVSEDKINHLFHSCYATN